MPPIDKKRLIRGTRILLTVFYGFLLSSILFRYIINGIFETIRRPTNVYAILMIVVGVLILISIGLSIYATWFDNTLIMLVSGGVLVGVFILTLVYGILRIVKEVPHRVTYATSTPGISLTNDESGYGGRPVSNYQPTSTADLYTIAEDVTKLIIELIFILFAILGTFVLYRYVKTKYAAVPTIEPKAA